MRVDFEGGERAPWTHCSAELEFFLSNVRSSLTHCSAELEFFLSNVRSTLGLCHYSNFTLQFGLVAQLPMHVALLLCTLKACQSQNCKTLLDKYEALKKLESGTAKKDVAAQYKVPANTLSTWRKNKDKIVKAFEGGDSHIQRKQRAGHHDAVDKTLYKWFKKVREEGVPISGGMLKEKASKYARELGIETFKASNGWFDRWNGKHGIVIKTASGEAKCCTEDIIASWKETTLPAILTNYQLRDIFNADEFGLFYKALPDKSLHLKSGRCIGGKHNKVHLTGMAAANAEGEKLPMFVIGKSVKPSCFTGVIIKLTLQIS